MTITAGIAAIFGAVRIVENRLVYAPPRYPLGFSEAFAGKAEEIWLQTSDRIRINACYYFHPDSHRVLLWFHGNAENIGYCLDQQRQVAEAGINVLTVEYRGYGKSAGKPDEAGVYRDADAGYDYLLNHRQFRAADIFVYGHSLGGAVAVDLASRRPCAGVIVQSSFTSAPAMARRMFPIPLIGTMMKSRFDSREKIRGVRAPVLIVHGTKDRVVPFEMGQELFQAAPEPKSFYAVEGAGHNNVLATGGEAYMARLKAFFAA